MKVLVLDNGGKRDGWPDRKRWLEDIMDFDITVWSIPELTLKKAPPRNDNNQRGLDKKWFNRHVLPFAFGYDWVHFSCTEKQWRDAGLDTSLGGRHIGKYHGIYCSYGQQKIGEKMPFENKLTDEVQIVILHEGCHVMCDVNGIQDRTHEIIKEKGLRAAWEYASGREANSDDPLESRDPKFLYEPLRLRWEYLKSEWEKKHPNELQPFLFTTYRSDEQQRIEYREGTTNAWAGESLHNYKPSYAFDFAFAPRDRSWVQWNDAGGLYTEFARMATDIGLEWGGDWNNDLGDIYHIQMPMTWRDAQAGRVPKLPSYQSVPKPPSKWQRLVNKFADQVELFRQTVNSRE